MRWFISILLLGVFLFVGGFFLFTNGVYDRPPDKIPPQVDLIVVLTGGSGRIAEGLRLLEGGFAPRVFVTGVEAADQFYLVTPGYDIEALKANGKLLIDPSAKNTKENALQTKSFLEKLSPKPKRLLLVTSTYHLPRAELIFRKTLPAEFELYVHPVV
ncbi:MAG TPA: YdcF family protein, partial [Bdellovibrionota bacterium]|nr:YdcF family protein [Bdellovibrionota bacterium]